ncbi:type IV pilus twitching motility protein PilT [Nocardioides sp. Kera G14]|uniref:type IV pilus twitching motility protein PilT n=1 Tax=Nocardioides sp. Kera G14 TaxID=2884264 RepID=UPI002AB1E728|nr:type IV pilus twitching motility protein PilT [Nocardioides sp. Kera G14]
MSQTDLDAILAEAAREGASDVHFVAGTPPLVRLNSALTPVRGWEEATLQPAWLEEQLIGAMTAHQRQEYVDTGELDMPYSLAGTGRFRVNVHRQRGTVAAAFRLVPTSLPALEQLGVPEVARTLALQPRGLVLVTGPTGSGKSTTLAAMVDIVNREKAVHIVTIEDPIEYLHRSKKALVTQREVGSDTRSFSEALRRVLRQDPDVILIGELRDRETIEIALTAAETGHLVLGTLHTQGAASTINRIIDVFPGDHQAQIRIQLADTLQGVISQTLLPHAGGHGRVVATEVMVRTTAVANLIREGDVAQLYSVVQTGSALQMHTLDQDLRRLVGEGRLDRDEAAAVMVDASALLGIGGRASAAFGDEWAEPAGDASRRW